MTLQTLTIVGVGLIGGSIGLAAKARGLARHVIGVGRNQVSLDEARRQGAIDEAYVDVAAGVPRADIVVFCTPVDKIAGQVLQAAPHCKPGALLTDAGSTKQRIVQDVDKGLPGHVAFVGGHPLAGSEKKGPAFADASLFVSRWTILTPTPRTRPEALERTRSFWQALGSRVRVMDPEAHDRALALTSHVPHLLASALAGILPADFSDLTASGFRDTTRIAAGDPALWTAIFVHNRAAVLQALRAVQERLEEYHRALEGEDTQAIQNLLAQAKKVRDALGS